MRNFFKPGEYNAVCDVCGFKFKSGQMLKRWDGAMVCPKDWETRHPLDLFRNDFITNPIPGGGGGGSPSLETLYILTELAEATLTESGDHLIWEE